MAKLLKMLLEYMDLSVLPCLRPGVLTFFGGGRGCAGALTRPSTRHLLPTNFEKTTLRKRVGIFTVKMRGGHIYGNYCISRMCHLIRLISKTQKNPELDILKMIYSTSWGVQGMLPHPAFSRLLCTWTYWGSLFHVFKQGWWLGTPKFSFETADVDNDNSLYLKK